MAYEIKNGILHDGEGCRSATAPELWAFAEIDRLQVAKRAALAIADERSKENVDLRAREDEMRKGRHNETRRALFMCAASCQGGHSRAGDAAANVLRIPFPITMENLIEKAREEGFDPDDLWPWMMRRRTGAERGGHQ